MLKRQTTTKLQTKTVEVFQRFILTILQWIWISLVMVDSKVTKFEIDRLLDTLSYSSIFQRAP